jgi:SAM-dependent methyltransferase
VSDAEFASSFGGAAEQYERGRPGYPPEAIDALARALGLGPASLVIDLAAGTGKFTRLLADRFGEVVAVEPLDEMRAAIVSGLPDVEAVDGKAESIPVADASADALFVAQAFHWFDGHRALDEVARVLRPAGGLALVWNTTPWERRETDWFALVDDLLEQSRAELSNLRRNASGRWREPFDERSDFEPLSHSSFDNTQLMGRREFLDGFASRSYVIMLELADREALLADLVALLERPDAPVEGDRVVVPMRTDCHWTRLTAAP